MNPTSPPTDSYCQWAIPSPFSGGLTRECGRTATAGVRLHLCWQHYEIMVADVVDSLYDRPNFAFSVILGNWIRSVAVDEHDAPVREKERSRSREVAIAALGDLLDYYGNSDHAPAHIQPTLDRIVESAIEARLVSTWGGVA